MKKHCFFLVLAVFVFLITGCPANPIPSEDPVISEIQVQPGEVNEGEEFTIRATITGTTEYSIILFDFNNEEKLANPNENYSTCSFKAPDVSTDTIYPIELTVKDFSTGHEITSLATVTVVYIPDPEPIDPEIISLSAPLSVNEGECLTVEATVTDEDSEFLVNFIFNGEITSGTRENEPFDVSNVLDGKYFATFTAPEVEANEELTVKVQVLDAVTNAVVESSRTIIINNILPVDPVITAFSIPEEVTEGYSFTAEATITDTDSSFDTFFTFNSERKPGARISNLYTAHFAAPEVEEDTAMDVIVEAVDPVTSNIITDNASIIVKKIPVLEIVEIFTDPETLTSGDLFKAKAEVTYPGNGFYVYISFEGERRKAIYEGNHIYYFMFEAPTVGDNYLTVFTVEAMGSDTSAYAKKTRTIWIN